MFGQVEEKCKLLKIDTYRNIVVMLFYELISRQTKTLF